MKLMREFLKFLALCLIVATFVLNGSLIAFIVKEFVNSKETFRPNGFFTLASFEATGSLF
jgi:hypothetical protein